MKLVLNNSIRPILFAGILLGGWTIAAAQEPAEQPATPQTDNTKVNQRDRNTNEPTADQQKDNRSDRDIGIGDGPIHPRDRADIYQQRGPRTG